MARFSKADLEVLRRPHVSKVWFGEFDLPTGKRYMHSGTGRLKMAGRDWIGVTDPFGNQMVGIQEINDPRFGQAAALVILIGGVNLEFFKSFRRDMYDIEGREAKIYWAAFDPETAKYVIGLRLMFPGKMSAPTLSWERGLSRVVSLNIESRYHAQNFPFGGMWSSTGQRERFEGDTGGDFIGVTVKEVYR